MNYRRNAITRWRLFFSSHRGAAPRKSKFRSCKLSPSAEAIFFALCFLCALTTRVYGNDLADNIYVGHVYHTDSLKPLNLNQEGAQADATLRGFCIYMAASDSHKFSMWPTFAEQRAVESDYDEFRTSNVPFRVIAGPFHPPCKVYATWKLYKVRVLGGTTRAGRAEVYLSEIEIYQ